MDLTISVLQPQANGHIHYLLTICLLQPAVFSQENSQESLSCPL